jgi:hypothetical protein
MIFAAQNLLQWLLGENPDRAGVPKLQWANLPESWGVFVMLLVIAAIVFAVVWMYRREINTCPMPVKLTMAGLRLAVVLLLVILYLKPAVFYQQVSEIKPTIALLRDRSISMDQTDQYSNNEIVKKLAATTRTDAATIADDGVKRVQLINQAFDKNPQLIQQLRDKGSIRVVDFATGSKQVALLPANEESKTKAGEEANADGDAPTTDKLKIPELVADGLGTNIYQAVRESLDDSSRVSAVVLVTEGQHNAGESPVAIAQKAANQAVPIFVVGVGDPNPPRNLSVNEIYVREKAYPDEPFEVEAVLQTTRDSGQGSAAELKVELVQQLVNDKTGSLGPPVPVKSQTVQPPVDGGRMRVDFGHVLGQPGKYVFTVRVPPIDGETDIDDNSKTSPPMEVVDAKVKVLLISGLPSWDYIQVTRLLQRDSTIQLSCWLQSLDDTRPQEGDAPITRLPTTLAELNEYNVIMLMDPNPTEFSAEWIEMLKTFCKRNFGGVMFVAGPQFSGEFVTMNRLSGIRELLPVRFGDNQSIEETEVLNLARDASATKMLPVNYNMDHPVMSFRSSPAESQEIWDVMPSIYWNFPTLDAKPTARVLLERGDNLGTDSNQPLLVANRFGAGSVLYMGFQESYRWRRLGVQAQYFDRFWIQAIRYLVESRSMQGARRGFLDTDKKQFELGQRVPLIGRVLDKDFEPSQTPTHQVVVRSDDGRSQKIDMKLVPNSTGRYEGSFDALRLGTYEATLRIAGETDQALIAPISFRVIPPSAESGADWLNEKLLRQIATESGGSYLSLADINALPAMIPDAAERVEFNSPAKPLWDCSNLLRWLFYLLPVVLLSAEWALRKWYKLL